MYGLGLDCIALYLKRRRFMQTNCTNTIIYGM